ncbi:MAG: ABC transporter ATP-binding protein [Tissierellia bacterium]|nr:ABC transporter ATP-binding protein [Tissierellia bacterium]
MKVIIKDLSLGYNEIILENLNFEIPTGSVFSLLGNSGIGKTTLIYTMAGLLKPLSGEIINMPKRLSVLFQEDRLFESFKVHDNISAYNDRLTVAEIESALERVGLGGIRKLKIGELSGGMKRRVAIVRTMLMESDLILMDEPFSGIDEENRKKTLDFIMEEKKERGIIFSSHSPIGIEDDYIVL